MKSSDTNHHSFNVGVFRWSCSNQCVIFVKQFLILSEKYGHTHGDQINGFLCLRGGIMFSSCPSIRLFVCLFVPPCQLR